MLSCILEEARTLAGAAEGHDEGQGIEGRGNEGVRGRKNTSMGYKFGGAAIRVVTRLALVFEQFAEFLLTERIYSTEDAHANHQQEQRLHRRTSFGLEMRRSSSKHGTKGINHHFSGSTLARVDIQSRSA